MVRSLSARKSPQRLQPLSLGTRWRADGHGPSGFIVSQHGFEFGVSHGQAVWGKVARAAGYRRAGCFPELMCCVVTYSTMVPSWSCQPGEFFQEAVWGRFSCDDLYDGDWWWFEEAWRGQRSDPVEQAVVPAVEKSVV